MPIRQATLADVDLLVRHRHLMFADNDFGTPNLLDAMDINFDAWLRAHLADGTYIGLLYEESGEALAGAAVYFMDWPPHYLDVEPVRAYLLNFYTAPEARGRGLANLLLAECVRLSHARGVKVITLHASPFGKPIYEKFGFKHSNEWMLKEK